jgi:hypothetical protein
MKKFTIFVGLVAIASPFIVSLALDGWIRDFVGAVNFSLGKIPNLSGKTAIVTGEFIISNLFLQRRSN